MSRLLKQDAELDYVFVFGSNLLGHHGAGAALHAAMHYEAEYGVGIGRTGQSYAIPTKDDRIETLPIVAVYWYTQAFLGYAKKHPHIEFQVTRIGCGLAGYTDKDIAPMFRDATDNVHLPIAWKAWLK